MAFSSSGYYSQGQLQWAPNFLNVKSPDNPVLTIGSEFPTQSYSETGVNANLVVNRVLTASVASFALSSNATIVSVQRKLALVQSTFAETGNTMSPTAQRKVASVVFPFTLSGVSIIFADGFPVTPGIFSLTGLSSIVSVQRKLALVKASFIETGNSTNITVQRRVSAVNLPISLTGNSVIFADGFPVTTGTFSLLSNPVILRLQRTLSTTKLSISETSINANLILGRRVSLSASSFVEVANGTGLTIQRKIGAVVSNLSLTGLPIIFGDTLPLIKGSFTLVGNNAILTYTPAVPVNHYTLSIAYGSFLYSGVNNSLRYGRAIVGILGQFALATNPSTILLTKVMGLNSVQFSLSGIDLGSIYHRAISPVSYSIMLSGMGIKLLKNFAPVSNKSVGPISKNSYPVGMIRNQSHKKSTISHTLTINQKP